MCVCTSSRAHTRCARAEIKEARADEISTRAEEDQFHFFFFTSSVATLRQISEQQKILSLDPVEVEHNRRHSLRSTREAQEDKKTASKPGDKLETPVLARER